MSTAQQQSYALDQASSKYVTMRLDKQLFGISVANVREVLEHQKVTPIPLAPGVIDGSLNLRGRIVTVINMRAKLGLPRRDDIEHPMFVVVEHHQNNELYSLVVDGVGEVLTVPNDSIEKPPANLSGAFKDMASGVYKLPEELLVIIDVSTMLTV